MNQKILVAGATGRTGRIIISQLLQHGIQPHALVRDISTAKQILGEEVSYHQGDVRQVESLLSPMHGVDTVISAIGSRAPVGKNSPKYIDYQGVANLLITAQTQHVRRFILISSIAVTNPAHPLNCFGKVLDWKLKGENVLRQSGVDYAIIRPGGLKDTPGQKRSLIFDQGDHLMGTLSREDLAEICLNALDYPHRLKVTFEAIEEDHKRQEINWIPLFAGFAQDKM